MIAMRWVFLLLIALNIFYWVWIQQQHPSLGGGVSSFVLGDRRAGDIKLLSERSDDRKATGVVQGDVGLCLHLGGYEADELLALLEQRLLALDIAAEAVRTAAQFAQDHWVYLPPLASRDAALRQLKELNARGIDGYLISQGDLENGLSLGIFSRLEGALSQLERMRAMGYAAELRELVRERRQYWVRVSNNTRPLLGEALIAALLRDFPGLRQEMLPCDAGLAGSEEIALESAASAIGS